MTPLILVIPRYHSHNPDIIGCYYLQLIVSLKLRFEYRLRLGIKINQFLFSPLGLKFKLRLNIGCASG